MTSRTMVVPTADGERIALRAYESRGSEDAVIICPGFFQSKETKTFQRLAEGLADGRDVLAMDFRGHGRSSGEYTFSAREGADLEAVLAQAEGVYARIVVVGFSLGAAVAINTVARRPGKVQGLIAVSGPASFEDIEFKWWTPEAMRTGLEGSEAGAGCRPGNLWLKKERAVDNISRVAPRPVLFVHGTRDAIVGVQHGRRLYEAAAEPKRLEIIEGGGHAEALFRDAPERFLEVVAQWLSATLAARP